MVFKYHSTVKPWKLYNVYYEDMLVGYAELFIKDQVVHIRHIFIQESWRYKVQFWKWLKQFEAVKAYDVLPESVMYWHKQGAEIVSRLANTSFEAIQFTEEDCYELSL